MQTAGDDENVLMFVTGDAVVSATSFGGRDRTRVKVRKGTVGCVGVGVVGGSSVVWKVVVVRSAVVIMSFGGSVVNAVKVYATATIDV